MILIGQYDSPFVRRVAIALHIYKLPYEHRPWSVFGDPEKLAEFNPLRRVPTLVLDTGEVLIESGAILDHLDQTVGPESALLPASGEARRHALKTMALATGMAEKAVSLVYERVLHDQQSETWIARCRTQIGAVLDALEAERETRESTWWHGDRIGHADIAVGCVLRFIAEAHPGVFDPEGWPRLGAHAAACEAREDFQSAQQAFYVAHPSA